MKYSEIKTMDELEACQKQVRAQIGDEGSAIASSLENLREAYSPMNMFARGLNSISDAIPYRQFMLMVVRYLIKVVKRVR